MSRSTIASAGAALSTTEGADTPLSIDRDIRRLWCACAALGAALLANQLVTLRTLKALILADAPNAPVASLGQRAWHVLFTSWQQLLGPADIGIAMAILLAAGYIVASEVRRGTATELLWRAGRSDAALWGFLSLVTLAIARVYIAPGQVFLGDTETHLLRSWMYAENFRHLDTPTWSNTWYGGFPLLAHYGPLYFICTALLTLATGDIHLATKILLLVCHVGSVFTMWYFLNDATRSRLGALVGALAYGLTFHRIHIVLYQGDLQVAIVLLLFPIALLLSERFLRTRERPRRTFVTLALVLAALILNHHGYAFFGLVFLGIYWLARLAMTPGSLVDRARALALLCGAGGASLLMSAFLLVPFMWGMAEHRGMGNSAFPILIPNPLGPLVLAKLLRWSALGDGGTIGYAGLSIAAMAVLGSRYGLRRRDPAVVGLLAAGTASLLMVHNRMSYNVKNIDFFIVFLTALAAWVIPAVEAGSVSLWGVVDRARARWRERLPARAAAVAVAVMLVDLGLTTFQSPFRENYEFKQPVYDRLATLSPYKTIERQVLRYDPAQPPDAYFDPNKLGVPSAFAGLESPLGFFHEGAGRSFAYSVEIVKQLHRDLNQGRLAHRTVEGLYVLGVRNVVFRDRYQWFSPTLEPSTDFTLNDGVLQTAGATPLVASTKVVTTADMPGFDDAIARQGKYLEPQTYDYSGRYYTQLVVPVLEQMGLDMTRGVARQLIAEDPALRVDTGGADTLRVDVERFSTDLKRVSIAYRASADAVGQIPFTYFSYLKVAIDGAPVEFFRSAFNTILVRLPAGPHTISILGVAPPLQQAMLWLSLAAFVAVVLLPARVFDALIPPSPRVTGSRPHR